MFSVVSGICDSCCRVYSPPAALNSLLNGLGDGVDETCSKHHVPALQHSAELLLLQALELGGWSEEDMHQTCSMHHVPALQH
jgi:hypothetical protein